MSIERKVLKMKITISKNKYVINQNVRTLLPVTEDWGKFIQDFKKPQFDTLSFNAYSSYLTEFYSIEEKETLTESDKERRKILKSFIDGLKFHGGYYFGGSFEGGRRGNKILSKSLITLDIDNISPDINFLDLLINNNYLSQFEYIVHSTAKHMPPNHQRYRLIIPLLDPIKEDISLKYECISRHIASTIMDIKYFDTSAFADNHLMLFPVIAQNTPSGYYFCHHNSTEKYLNPDGILKNYDYHDRYTFQGVERPRMPAPPDTHQDYRHNMLSNRGDLITSMDKERIKDYLPNLLNDYGINAPYDLNNNRRKFGCVCGSSDANNYGRGKLCNCFSSNHDSNLGRQGNGCYTYDIFDLYAYKNGLDSSREFVRIAYDLAQRYNISLENGERVENYINPPSAFDDFKNVQVDPVTGEVSSMDNIITYDWDGNPEPSQINSKQVQQNSTNWMAFLDFDKWDKIKNTLNNINLILNNDENFRDKIAYNDFTCRKQFDQKNWTDKDDSKIKLYIERNYGIRNVTIDNIIHACNIITDEHRYHPIRNYLNGITWDGKTRIDTLFIDFLGAKENEYTRKVARVTLISAVARIFNPGCKVDTVACLVGKQGLGKSKFIGKLAVSSEWFTDSVTSFDGKEFYETIQGKWIVEIGEGTAFKKSLKETAKQRIASQQDTYRTPYARYTEDRPRQCIFMATTNSYDFLKDETGDRRYYPIDCEKKNARLSIDKDLSPEYIAQLWAEAVYCYKNGEKVYIIEDNILALAEQEQKAHFDESPLQSDIYNFLEILLPTPPEWYGMDLYQRRRYITAIQNGEDTSKTLGRVGVYKRDRVSVKEIMCELFGYELNQPIERKMSLDVARSLTALGWNRSKKAVKFKPYGVVKVFTKD